jgi:GNAT superfamily N-acetyltransferase
MNDEYTVMRYRPELRADVLALFRMQGAKGLDVVEGERHWRWKYEENPYLREPLAVVAADSTRRLVGMLGLYGSMWQFGESPGRLLVPCPVDAYVAPDHRRRGLYRRLFTESIALARERGWEYLFSLSSGKETYTCNAQLGARSLGYRLPSMHYPGPPVPSGNGRRSRMRAVPRHILETGRRRVLSATGRAPVVQHMLRSAYQGLVSAARWRHDPFELFDEGAAAGELTGTYIDVTSRPRPDAMATLAERVSGDGRIRHVKDTTYFSWRFRRQDVRYRFLFVGTDELEGYVVLQSGAHNGASVSVVDWEVAHPDVLADLLKTALRLGRFSFVWIPWSGPPGPTTDALERIGFVFDDVDASTAEAWPFTVEVNLVRGSSDGVWMLGDRYLLEPLDWDLRLLYADAV